MRVRRKQVVAFLRHFANGNALHEVVDAQRGTGAGCRVRRQNRVGTQREIPQANRRVLSKQDLSSVANPIQVIARIACMNLKMLRCELVHEFNRRIHVFRKHDSAPVAAKHRR